MSSADTGNRAPPTGRRTGNKPDRHERFRDGRRRNAAKPARAQARGPRDCPRDYSAARVGAWASLAPTRAGLHARATDGCALLVAVDGADRPVAFGDLEADGHIDLFYCAPEAAGTGVAPALYDALKVAAWDCNLTRR